MILKNDFLLFSCDIWSVCQCASIMLSKSHTNIVKIKVTECPSVANSVKRTQCDTTTSAPVERVFSHGGIVVRPHRSILAPERLHKILFFKMQGTSI